MSKKTTAAVLIALSVFSANSVLASDRNFNSDEFKKLNVCAPHVDIVQDISTQIRELKNDSTAQEIDSLENKIDKRKNTITSLKNNVSNLRSQKTTKERRLDKLTNNMSQLIAEIDKLIAQEDKNIRDAQASVDHNKKKKSECKGGLLGSFCRKKYRSRIEDAEKNRDKAKARKTAQIQKKSSLPGEKKALPGQIANLQKQIVKVGQELSAAENAKPSLAEMEKRLQRLENQNQAVTEKKKRLKKQLNVAENTLEKCRHLRFQSQVYETMMEQAQAFRERPSLCREVDYLVRTADKEFKKRGIQDASNLVCDMALELESLSIDDDNGNEIEEQVIRLDKEISSPVGEDGSYPDNFRTTDKKAKLIDQIGQNGVSRIRFDVEFDIEKGYDFMLVEDENGNVLEKIDGQGQKTVEVEASRVKILFYSDGMTGGRGFRITNIELYR